MKTFYLWLKSKAATIGLVLGGIMLALTAAKAAKNKAIAKRKNEQITDLLESGAADNRGQADKLIKKAEKHKQAAADAKDKLAQRLGELSEANTDIDSVADRFNSKRVRRAG